MKTALDETLDKARLDPGAGDKYINMFLNSEIFVPVWENPEEVANDGQKVEIRPILTNNEDGEFVMGFDTKDRLESWMDTAGGAATLKGFDLLVLVKGKPVQICMNAGTQYMKVFTIDEIKWLLQNSKIDES